MVTFGLQVVVLIIQGYGRNAGEWAIRQKDSGYKEEQKTAKEESD